MLDDHDEIDDEALTGEATVVIAAFSPGTFFADRFRIERVLGYGGMGSVYLATDLSRDEVVALKVLKKSALKDEAAERFRREVQVLGAVNHPGIIGIKGFGYADDGTPWLAMELLDGETLRDRVKRQGPISERALVPILDAAGAALTEAHKRGVVHRDLKPDHLFLPSAGSAPVKILDFGLSLSVGSKKLTKTGTVLGTPRYMAPEQIASAHNADGQVDVYALGVIVYEALAGHSPFAASDHGQLLGAILQGRIEPLGVKRPDLVPDVIRVVERAMARSREDRWRTPDEFARAFGRAVRGEAVPGLDDRRSDPHDPAYERFIIPSPGMSSGHHDKAAVLAAEKAIVRQRAKRIAVIVLLGFGALAIVAISAFVSYHLLK